MGSPCHIKINVVTTLPWIVINTGILLGCLIPGIKYEHMINGRVRNMKIDNNETRIGIEFENLQPHLADIMGKYLYSLESMVD